MLAIDECELGKRMLDLLSNIIGSVYEEFTALVLP